MEVHCVQLVLLSWHYLLLTGSRIATDLDPEWKCSRTTAGTIQYHCTVEWEKTPEIGKSWRVIYFFPPFLSESTELASADFHLFEHYFSSTYPPLCGHKTLFEIWLSLLILQQMWWKDSGVCVKCAFRCLETAGMTPLSYKVLKWICTFRGSLGSALQIL